MFFRLFTFFLTLALGILVGAQGWSTTWDWQGAALGAALSATVWVMSDLWRGHRVLNWVIREELEQLPTRWGLWGELADRMRRIQRRMRQEVVRSDERLLRLTAAVQASPNGVLLLDGGNHIEWCNQTAAQHLGLDAQRDRLQLITNLVRDPAFVTFMQGETGEQGVVIEGRLSRPNAP
ncbi:MAG: PAS domain-containing protein, partial [Limnohabitans sp.]